MAGKSGLISCSEAKKIKDKKLKALGIEGNQLRLLKKAFALYNPSKKKKPSLEELKAAFPVLNVIEEAEVIERKIKYRLYERSSQKMKLCGCSIDSMCPTHYAESLGITDYRPLSYDY